jgi:LuxR family transcriptional regulator, maltose regulon positive regulatory protein
MAKRSKDPANHELEPWDQIVVTKLLVPPARAGFVDRPRLTLKLSSISGGALVLVSAPAGFGKTTFLGDWARSSAVPVAWLSLEPTDNDPARFVTYVRAALNRARCQVPDTESRGMEPDTRHLTPDTLQRAITTVINEIAATEREVALVLDDFHLIENPAIHDAVAFLVEHSPPNLRLVISGRTDPPLPLGSLRAAARLIEIRADDLGFRPGEAARFIESRLGRSLEPETLDAIEAGTEGWAAGLQLVALALESADGGRDPLPRLDGSHRYVFDYLAEEVFQGQLPEVQTFLLKTSILDRLCTSLCDAVTGADALRANDQFKVQSSRFKVAARDFEPGTLNFELERSDMLEAIERANLFLVPLDDERRWFRYHHLFAEFLRARLEKDLPSEAARLHDAASKWFEEHRMPGEAIRHALASGDYDRASLLIELASEATIQRGELATLLGWLDGLPRQVVRQAPGLGIWYAWMMLLTGQLHRVEPFLLQAESRLLEIEEASAGAAATKPHTNGSSRVGDPHQAAGQVAVIRSCLALRQGDVAGAIDQCRLALDRLQKSGIDNPTMRSITAANLGEAHLAWGDLAAAARAFKEAQSTSYAAGETYNAAGFTSALAQIYVLRGDLGHAERAYAQALEILAPPRFEPVPALGKLYSGLGNIYREWNRLEQALPLALKGVALSETGAELGALLIGYVSLARVRQALGDREGALAALEKAAQAARRSNSEVDAAYVQAWRVRTHLAQGDTRMAARLVEELEADPALAAQGRPLLTLREVTLGGLARVRIALGAGREVLSMLRHGQSEAEAADRMGFHIEFAMLEALALQSSGDTAQAVIALTRALAFAEPRGYIRLFVDESLPVFRLLTLALQSQRRGPYRLTPSTAPSAGYVRLLLQTLGDDLARTGEAGAPCEDPADSLTPRELEVARLLCGRLSYHDIAERLVVTENTAKWHVKNVYRKLQVAGRADLIERAQELGLLA